MVTFNEDPEATSSAQGNTRADVVGEKWDAMLCFCEGIKDFLRRTSLFPQSFLPKDSQSASRLPIESR